MKYHIAISVDCFSLMGHPRDAPLRILFQDMFVELEKNLVSAFTVGENMDSLPGREDSVKIYGTGFNLETNALAFKADFSITDPSDIEIHEISFQELLVFKCP